MGYRMTGCKTGGLLNALPDRLALQTVYSFRTQFVRGLPNGEGAGGVPKLGEH